MFYIPKTSPARSISLKSSKSPAAAVQNASKRFFDSMVQSLATVSMAYGHYPAMPCQTTTPCTAAPASKKSPPLKSTEQLCRPCRTMRPGSPLFGCDFDTIPNKIADRHNKKELKKAELIAKRRPKSEIYIRRNFMDSLDSLADGQYRQVYAREFV
ncbi:hypothetical protein TWF694_003171 [Orbilia ellipsospora]|uniref:Uncharacterized protein n=1 Tax=Orbilia ellipsospora TaxID=2528407 RepID=A0AAV9X141_9PEZI